MEGVRIKDYGLRFVWECLKRYFGDSWQIALVCLAGLLVSAALMIFRKKKDGVSSLNWVLLIVLGLTVYNPFLVRIIAPKIGMTTVYYRFFWAYPFLPAAAYYLTSAVFLIRRKGLRAAACAGVIALMAVLMPVNPGIFYHMQLPDNVYKVNGAIPVICDAIHEDFEQSTLYQKRTRQAEGTDPLTKKGARAFVLTLPRCVFPYDMEFQVRQYDPSVTLTVGRNMRLYYEGNKATGVSYSEGSASYRRRKLILDAMYGRDPSISAEKFRKAMKKTRTHYLIVEDTQDSQDFLTAAGCTLIGDQAGYHIYSYGLTRADDAASQ